jgi:hypothetical protein
MISRLDALLTHVSGMVILRKLRRFSKKFSQSIMRTKTWVSNQTLSSIQLWSKLTVELTIFKKLSKSTISWSRQRKKNNQTVSQTSSLSTRSLIAAFVVERCIRLPKSLSTWKSKAWLTLLTLNLGSIEMWSLISLHSQLSLRATADQKILREL